MSHNNPPVRSALIAALKEHGPMTRHDLAELLDWTVDRVHSVIGAGRMRYPGQIFRVVGYRRASQGKGKDASIYAAEAGPDQARKAKVAARRVASQRRYRQKHNAAINSRTRAMRAAKAGRPGQASPWAQLASPAARAAMAQIQIRQKAQRQPNDRAF